ncbi:MAG: homoserine dehydrogenase [Lachnospiraceae bacterium]|nr:homoserine dehydrogenase [Lachnospiraceae bacterium]
MKVAILGYGTVGSGVFEVLNKNKDIIMKKAGIELETAYVLDLRDFPGDPVEKVLTHDVNDILNDPDVKVVAEVMGGVGAALKFTRAALEAGKSVCTSNKELVATHGSELMKIAQEHGCRYLFEASVGGGIPLIRPIMTALDGDDIIHMKSILNGTTNYILTRMSEAGAGFEEALGEAQKKGYAEADPTADVEGHDAMRKTAILASILEGKYVSCDDVHTEGISAITVTDFKYARRLHAGVKLLSVISRENGKITAMVAPFLVREDNELYGVKGVKNASLICGNAVGDIMFYGSGAGKLPTASAVVADMSEAARCMAGRSDVRQVPAWTEEHANVVSYEESKNASLIRVAAADEKEARKAFGDIREVAPSDGEFAFITPVMSEKDFKKAAAGLKIIGRIRTDFHD